MEPVDHTPDDPHNGDRYAESAGNPGAAAELPPSTGRFPEAGEPDVILDESLLTASTSTDPEGAQP
ncbi:hypothetical protein ACPA54_19435 [Uniformispora flossi]|uniref:Uncharacterized protein n=1 Tax=Yinghuangia aomiensis TaxID=676205 RepID=A0ABP9GWU3_9ACTN